MKTQNQKIDFSKNVKVSVDIQDLSDLGWELSDELESKETYHIDVTVNKDRVTTWCLTNTKKGNNGIWEGSDSEETGDDEQTIKDLEKLYAQGKLRDVRTEYYGA